MTEFEQPIGRRRVLQALLVAGPALAVLRPGAVRVAEALAATPAGPTSGRIREFTLTVGRVPWTLASGQSFEAYAYNGQIPGPELRVTEGDIVAVTVVNQLAEPTSVHWHGVNVAADMDGAPQTAGAPIPPGGQFTYRFAASPAGTRWYHSHVNELHQQGGGLAGALLIEPRRPAGPAPGRDYTLLAQAWTPTDLSGDTAVGHDMNAVMDAALGGQQRVAGHTFNGKLYQDAPPLQVEAGQLVRLRLINATTRDTLTFALAGHTVTLTHTDGNPLARPVQGDAVSLAVGERADVEFRADNPGRWQLRGFVEGSPVMGPAVDLVYAGHEGTAPVPPTGAAEPIPYSEMAGPLRPSSTARVYDLKLSRGSDGSGWVINDRSYPETVPLDVTVGEEIALRLVNMSMEDHPMHLHGHSFQITAIGDRAIDGPIKDTVNLRHMERYEVRFLADNPGRWLFHCHNLDHMMAGLMTELHYL